MNPSYLQTNFLGGQWSASAQGRADEEGYRTALNRSFNALPVEAGAHTRRPGTIAPGTTRKGRPGIVREFHFSQAHPYNLEFTDGILRLWAGAALMLKFQHTIASVTSANPAVINVPGVGTDWSAGDTIQMALTPVPGTSPAGVNLLFNRQFQLGTKTGTTFPLLDPVTGANIDGSALNTAGWAITGAKVVEFATPYTFGTAWKTTQLRVVQDQDTAFILVPGFAPATLQNVGTAAAPSFQWTAPGSVVFVDGPYLDPPIDGSTMMPSGVSGSVTLTASSPASINAGAGFVSTDVGRFIRLFSEPLDWAIGTHYTVGSQVRFETGAGPAYYQAIAANTGVQPDTDTGTKWAITTTAAAWGWAIISGVTNATNVTATLQGSRTDVFQQPLAGGNLKFTNPCKVWRLGSWSGTTGYPTVGGFHEGRFWFAGAVANRFETTMSQENFDFAPTLLDSTVADNNGISETIKSKEQNDIFWIASVEEGVILGTQGGEWAVRASQLGEAITPTSITAKKATRYGCANIEPRDAGMSIVFVQRYNKQVFEYLADVYSRKFSGTNIARRARNLTAAGVVEIAYTFENAPVLWARTANDALIGCTYKRESPFSTQPASFFGWHFHTLGSNRTVQSISAGPSPDGTVDTLCAVTYDTVTQIHYIEFLTPVFEETAAPTSAWFLDGAVTPAYGAVVGSNLVLYGLQYLVGQTVTAWIGGLDAGDYTVSAAGTITVPIDGSANPLLTAAKLTTLNAQGGFGLLGVNIVITPAGQGFFSPVGVSLGYVASSNAGIGYAQMSQTVCFDWDAGLLYNQQAQVGGDPGTNGHSLFIFNIATRAQVAGPLDPGTGTGGGANLPYSQVTCLGYDGHIYYTTGASANLAGRWNTVTHTNDLSYNDTHSLADAGYVTAIRGPDGEYLFATGVNSGTGGGSSAPWFIINMTGGGGPAACSTGGFFDEGNGSITLGNAFPCRGPIGRAYVIVLGTLAPGYAGPPQLGVYEAVVDGPTVGGIGKIGVVIPSQVHSGWTSFAVGVPIYDETDGNIIALFNNSGVFVLAKISTSSAAVLWTIVVTSSVDFHTSRVRGGRMSFVMGAGSPYTMAEIDTIAGTMNTSLTETAIAPEAFSTDDTAGQIVLNINDAGTTSWATFGPASGGGAITPALVQNAPAVIGFNYISQGQILRALLPQEVGDQTGPALGKTRRAHMYSALLVNTQGIKVGTDFTKMRVANLLTAGRTQALAKDTLFTDVIQDTLEDTASFHSMWAWQTDRPYPTTVASVEVFLNESPR